MATRPKHLFSLERYEEMIERGVLTSGDHVELLAGEIVEMLPIGTRHNASVARATRALTLALQDRAIVMPGGAIAIPPNSEPQPDIAVLRYRSDFYASIRPKAQDVLLLIEVSESSLAFDRGYKKRLYERSGIVEYWIADLVNNVIERYADPRRGEYAAVRVFRGDERVPIGALPDLQIRASDILAG